MTAPEITVVDVRGLTITTAIAQAVRPALAALPEGAELELVADRFPALRPDLEAWGRFAGHEVVTMARDGDHVRVRLRRTAPLHTTVGSVAVVVSADGLEEVLSPLGFALAAALEGADVRVYLQGPGVHLLRPGFEGHLGGVARPFSRFARAGLDEVGHVAGPVKLAQLQALGGRVYACGPSLDRFKVDPDRLALPDVTVCEYLTFMEILLVADVQLYC